MVIRINGVYCADKVTVYSFSLKLRGLENKNDFNQGSLSKLRYELGNPPINNRS
ncbi:hypothetical protein MOXK23_02620 [Moraxella sp. K23]